mgnify:FL=1
MRRLGELEATVMDVLWSGDGPMSVRDVRDVLDVDRRLAYTTVMTVLDNLHRKGYVERVMRGRAYQYRPAFTRSRASAEAMREILQGAGDPEAALLHFVTSVTDAESELLRSALERRDRRK